MQCSTSVGLIVLDRIVAGWGEVWRASWADNLKSVTVKVLDVTLCFSKIFAHWQKSMTGRAGKVPNPIIFVSFGQNSCKIFCTNCVRQHPVVCPKKYFSPPPQCIFLSDDPPPSVHLSWLGEGMSSRGVRELPLESSQCPTVDQGRSPFKVALPQSSHLLWLLRWYWLILAAECPMRSSQASLSSSLRISAKRLRSFNTIWGGNSAYWPRWCNLMKYLWWVKLLAPY